MNALKNMRFNFLKIMDLSSNFIKNIRPLENLDMPMIKTILLNENLIDKNLQKNDDIVRNLLEKFHGMEFLY